MPRTLRDVQVESLDRKSKLAEMGGKLDTVRDLLVSATGAVMTGDKSSAMDDILEAYEDASVVMMWIDEERGAIRSAIADDVDPAPIQRVTENPFS